MTRPKPRTERKTIVLRVRVTEAQRRMFEAAARAVGLDASAWVRTLAVQAAHATVKKRAKRARASAGSGA